jgi:hypothetical protein
MATRPIGLPEDDVFVFEEETFSRLRDAYREMEITHRSALFVLRRILHGLGAIPERN